MTLGRSICRIAICIGIYAGASILPGLNIPVNFLSTDQGKELLTKLVEFITSVVAGNTANAIDSFQQSCQRRGSSDGVSLENENLMKLSGKAITKIIAQASQEQNYNLPTRKYLKKIAENAEENWLKLSRSEFSQSLYRKLSKKKIADIITYTEEEAKPEKILTVSEWFSIFMELEVKAMGSSPGFDIGDVRQDIAKLLDTGFTIALVKVLEENFRADGKAFTELMIQMITGIKQEVEKQGQFSIISLTKLDGIKKQLTGNEQQIEKVFIDISNQMQNGFYEVCVRIGIVEKSINQINQILQKIKESVEEATKNTQILIHSNQEIIENQKELKALFRGMQQRDQSATNYSHPRDRPENKLYQALLHLNYVNQISLFENFLRNSTDMVAAFLLYGKHQSAPRWLLNCLLQNVLNVKNREHKIINVPLFFITQSINLSTISAIVGRKLGINKYSVQDIAEETCRIWITQTVIFTMQLIPTEISDLDTNNNQITKEYIDEIIYEFWKPIAELAHQRKRRNHNYRLLLFIIDQDGYMKDWEIGCSKDSSSPFIKFPEIEPIPRIQVLNWANDYIFNENILEFRESFIDEVFEVTSNKEQIEQDSACQRICEICDFGIEWKDYLSWIKDF